MRTVRTINNGNRFIEQYEWTIGMCITVQIGEHGNFTDVQIGKRGKQRVKVFLSWDSYKKITLQPIVAHLAPHLDITQSYKVVQWTFQDIA